MDTLSLLTLFYFIGAALSFTWNVIVYSPSFTTYSAIAFSIIAWPIALCMLCYQGLLDFWKFNVRQ